MAKEEKIKKEKKGNKKEVKKSVSKKGKAKKVQSKKDGGIKGIKKELKLVKWPTAKEIVKYTIATVIFCLILVAFFEILNMLLAFIKGLFN